MIAEGCPICLAHNLWLPLGRISPVKMVEIKTKKYRWNSNRKCSSDWNEDHSLDYTELYYTQHQLTNHLVWRRYKKLLRLERTANEKFKPLSPSTKKYEHWRLAFMKICYIKGRISPTYLPNIWIKCLIYYWILLKLQIEIKYLWALIGSSLIFCQPMRPKWCNSPRR